MNSDTSSLSVGGYLFYTEKDAQLARAELKKIGSAYRLFFPGKHTLYLRSDYSGEAFQNACRLEVPGEAA